MFNNVARPSERDSTSRFNLRTNERNRRSVCDVIYESQDYKPDLIEELDAVVEGVELARDDHDVETSLLRLEKFVFWTAFITRKMREANKLSDELEAEEFAIDVYPRIDGDRLQDFMNWHKIEKFYDFGSPGQRVEGLRWICDQLIHSFVFFPQFEAEDELTGILFNSDKSRHEALFRLAWPEFERLVQLVATDDVVSMHYDRRTGELRKSRVGLPEDGDYAGDE
jgi:hypothetical protein